MQFPITKDNQVSKKKNKRDKVYAEELTPAIVSMKDKSKASRDQTEKELKNTEEMTNEAIEELLRSSGTGNNK